MRKWKEQSGIMASLRVTTALLGLLFAMSACNTAKSQSIIQRTPVSIPVTGNLSSDQVAAAERVNLKPTASPRVSAAGIPGAEYGQAAYNIAYPTRPALPDGALNVAYPALQFLVKGGFSPYLFTIEEGQLPQGMTFSKSGILSGVPVETGNFHFTIRIVDGLLFYPSALRTSYTLHIAAEAPVISTNMIPPVVNVGSAASQPEDSGSPSSPTTPPAQAPAPAPAQAPTQVTVSSAQPEPVQNVQAPQPKEPKPPKKPPKGKGKGG